MKRSLAVISLLTFAVAAPGQAADATSPVLGRIVESGKLRVGMTGDQAPLNARTRDGELIGLEVDLAGALATAMGAELQLVTKPFGDLLAALRGGEVDIVMSGMTITPQRNLEFAFVGPYFVSGKAILTKSSALAASDEADDINEKKYKLAALEGSTSKAFVEVFAPRAKLVTAKNYDEAVQLVLDDEVDALVADYPACVLAMVRHPDSNLATVATPLTVEPIGIAVPAGDALLVNFLQNFLGALEATGLLEQLQKRWFEDASWVQQLP